MPSDGFSLAVFITCEPDDVGLVGLFLELLDLFLFILGDLIQRSKSMLDIDAEILLVQVADVTETRHHFIIVTQKLLNGLCLGRGLNNN